MGRLTPANTLGDLKHSCLYRNQVGSVKFGNLKGSLASFGFGTRLRHFRGWVIPRLAQSHIFFFHFVTPWFFLSSPSFLSSGWSLFKMVYFACLRVLYKLSNVFIRIMLVSGFSSISRMCCLPTRLLGILHELSVCDVYTLKLRVIVTDIEAFIWSNLKDFSHVLSFSGNISTHRWRSRSRSACCWTSALCGGTTSVS